MSFKQTSELIAVSFRVDELVAGTFAQDEIALQLDILNNEIFVVLACDLNTNSPEMITATNTSIRAGVTSTAQTAAVGLSQTNTIAVAQEAIRTDAVNAVSFARSASESYVGNNLSWIALIATNNFFVHVQGFNNVGTSNVEGRLWGYRAKADASTYAALVQSEVLSA